MPRSWVMKTIAMSSRRCRSASSARICAWMVTSSAVVGSSAIRMSGIVGERHGDHHALALAAGEFVRVGIDAPLGIGNADQLQQFQHARAGLRLGVAAMIDQRLGDLAADPVERIERGHRLLEDHGDLLAAHLVELRFGQPDQFLVAVFGRSAWRGRWRQAGPSSPSSSGSCRNRTRRRSRSFRRGGRRDRRP